jgi:hypothetical protein
MKNLNITSLKLRSTGKLILSLLFISLTIPHFAYMMEGNSSDPEEEPGCSYYHSQQPRKRKHCEISGEEDENVPQPPSKRECRRVLSSCLPKEVLFDQIFPSLHHPIDSTLLITYWAAARDLIHNIINAFVADGVLPVLVLEYIETRIINPLIGYNPTAETILSVNFGISNLLKAAIALHILTEIRNAKCSNLGLWQRIVYGIRDYFWPQIHTTFCQSQYCLIKTFLQCLQNNTWEENETRLLLSQTVFSDKQSLPKDCSKIEKKVDYFYSDKFNDNGMLCLVQFAFVLKLFDGKFLNTCLSKCCCFCEFCKEIHILLAGGAIPSMQNIMDVIECGNLKTLRLLLEYSNLDIAQRGELVEFAQQHAPLEVQDDVLRLLRFVLQIPQN